MRIELQPSTTETKPQLVFETPGLKHCEDDLRSRGFVVETQDDSVSITDPDGSAVVFVENRHTAHAQRFGSNRQPNAEDAPECRRL